jgi:hypothetical protein
MKVMRLYANNWVIVEGWRLIASGFESEEIALSYITLVEADDELTGFRNRGKSAAGDADFSGMTLKR